MKGRNPQVIAGSSYTAQGIKHRYLGRVAKNSLTLFFSGPQFLHIKLTLYTEYCAVPYGNHELCVTLF